MEHCNNDLIRRHEEILIANQTMLNDFMRRYDQDRIECVERYREDRAETLQWRTQFSQKIDDLNIFINELRPTYKRLMAFVGVVVLGSIGTIFGIIWNHVTK